MFVVSNDLLCNDMLQSGYPFGSLNIDWMKCERIPKHIGNAQGKGLFIIDLHGVPATCYRWILDWSTQPIGRIKDQVR
jgi:hypothetical protein